MTKQQYEKISRPFRAPAPKKALLTVNRLLTYTGYAIYPLMLIYLFFTANDRLLAAVLVPGSGFVLLTVIRSMINRPRPYETLDIDPIIKKNTKGNSFPSRHVFSMAEIAVTAFLISQPLGWLLLFFSMCLAAIRVIGGVHYPSDVAAGILCAVIWCCIGYTILL